MIGSDGDRALRTLERYGLLDEHLKSWLGQLDLEQARRLKHLFDHSTKRHRHWTTKDRRKIKVKDLGDKHLYNTFNMLRRKPNSYLGWIALLKAELEWRGLPQTIPQFDKENAEWEARNG